jgi:hypothetical protein
MFGAFDLTSREKEKACQNKKHSSGLAEIRGKANQLPLRRENLYVKKWST